MLDFSLTNVLAFLGIMFIIMIIAKLITVIYKEVSDNIVKATKRDLNVPYGSIDLHKLDRETTDHKYHIQQIERRLDDLENPKKKRKS